MIIRSSPHSLKEKWPLPFPTPSWDLQDMDTSGPMARLTFPAPGNSYLEIKVTITSTRLAAIQ